MEDLLRYLLIASDPALSSYGLEKRRRQYARRQGGLLPETIAMLVSPEEPPETPREDPEQESDSEQNSDSSSDNSSDSSSGSDD